jgi:hypothetical protein
VAKDSAVTTPAGVTVTSIHKVEPSKLPRAVIAPTKKKVVLAAGAVVIVSVLLVTEAGAVSDAGTIRKPYPGAPVKEVPLCLAVAQPAVWLIAVFPNAISVIGKADASAIGTAPGIIGRIVKIIATVSIQAIGRRFIFILSTSRYYVNSSQELTCLSHTFAHFRTI